MHIPNRENILCYSEMVEEKFIIVVIINWLNVQNTEKNTAFVFYNTFSSLRKYTFLYHIFNMMIIKCRYLFARLLQYLQ